MTIGPVFVIGALAAVLASPVARAANGRELAARLADTGTQRSAIDEIVARGQKDIPLLLSWTRALPDVEDKYELMLGMAQVFGRLKTTEAIPFLIKNISLQVFPQAPNTFMKTPEVIEGRMPAIVALINIGPEASRALLRAPIAGMTSEDRLAVIFTISRIPGVPKASEFLMGISGQANMERFWAENGLKYLDEHH
jgi:hypothetical protein